MEYVISIRIDFPDAISAILRQEKERFVAKYGSKYGSEPHITLYLDRYTPEGYSKLVEDLKEIRIRPFVITLLQPKIIFVEERQSNHYVLGVSGEEGLKLLQGKVSEIARRYESPSMRSRVTERLKQQGVQTDGTRESMAGVMQDEIFDPHITLGDVAADEPQPDLKDIRTRLKKLGGEEIIVSSIIVVFDGKKESDKMFKSVEKFCYSFDVP
jgi:2'-5' RNA ligase